MANTLAAGLSAGLSGFCFWSHDIGGFSGQPEPELMLSWAFMGAFSSHSRVHGLPPREPWHFDKNFLNTFKRIIKTRYQLLPYIIAQAYQSCECGLPMIRPTFLQHENDPTCWALQDQYMFGESLMIAPVFAANTERRQVYLPKGKWFNFFTAEHLDGPGWHDISVSEIKGIVLVKSGCILPMVDPADSTGEIDWSSLTLAIYATEETQISGPYFDGLKVSELSVSRTAHDKWQSANHARNDNIKLNPIPYGKRPTN